MPDRPERNPTKVGPTYRPPGDSFIGAATQAVKDIGTGLGSLANRVATAWTAAGQQPASAGPPEKKPTVPPVSAGFAGPAAAPALKPAAKPDTSGTLYPTQGGQLHSTEAGMDPDFRKNLIKAKGEAPEGGATLMGPRSGFRSLQQQKDIYNAATNKSMVAKPGGSMHGKGIAADLKYHSPEERQLYHDKAGIKAGFHFPLQGQAPGIPKEPWHAEKVGSRSASWKGFVPIPKRKPVAEDKEFDKGMANWWKQGLKSYTNASKKKPLKDKEVKKEKLDEFKSPWAGIDKANADTARWRKNREEGKQAVTDAKTERHPGWLKGVVKDYMSAKYGVKKEEKLDEVYPPMWAGYPAHMEKLRKEHEAKKKADKEKESEKKEVKESGTQTSPGVESEEHPKKFELPEKYEGTYSVRNIYMDEARAAGAAASPFYGTVADSPSGGTAANRLASAPKVVRKPVAAAAPAAKPAAVPAAPATAPTTTPAATPTAQPTAPSLSATPEPAIKSSAPGPLKGTVSTTPTVNPNAFPAFKGPDVNVPGSKNINPEGGSSVSPKGLFARAQVLPTGGAAPQAAAPTPQASAPAPAQRPGEGGQAFPPFQHKTDQAAAPTAAAKNIGSSTPTPSAPAKPEGEREYGPFSSQGGQAFPGDPFGPMIKDKINSFLNIGKKK